ncbi:MAG: phosphate acyltransferase, partial [Alphaproteobacteria bacterium]
ADMAAYRRQLRGRLNPTADLLQFINEQVKADPKRVVFAEGEEEKVIRAAVQYLAGGYGTPVLIGREERIFETMRAIGLARPDGLEIHNARLSRDNGRYTDFLYARTQRQGFLHRDAQRLVNQDRNVFAALMVACGDADALVTGVTRNYFDAYDEIRRVIDPRPDHVVFGMTALLAKGRTVLMADTSVNELPTAEELASIAIQAAAAARAMGQEPRVALLSYSNFGNPGRQRTQRIRDAVAILDSRKVDFEYDGEMSADVALNHDLMRRLYPFCRLGGPANVLIMPALHSANIASKMLQVLGGGVVIGPLLMGLSASAQIVEASASVSDLVGMAVLAAHAAARMTA